MSSVALVLACAAICAGSAVLALACARAPRLATQIAMLGAVAGCALGLCGALGALGAGASSELTAAWQVPGGSLVVGVDPLSAFFLVPLFGLGALCAVYGRSYLGARPIAAAQLGLLLAAMTLVLVARHALLFLVAWEAMALVAYLLVTLDDDQAEVRRAGWVYLIASHVAVVALIGTFLVLASRAGGALDFAAFAQAWRDPAPATAILALALLGFGIKAGVIGLHVWLPEAHAAAPSHVSALMSGVLIKLGLYGLLRVALLLSPGAWFGVALMVLGAAGALLGIALAIYQRDLKRALAYSSVENVGVILLGLGLGFWARARGDASLAALAFGGALLHVWNHAAMKGLMFLSAGNILHAAGTKDTEQLGGLLRRMPRTGPAMIAGAVAIAALPPLNGFTSEWLLYRGLTRAALHSTTPFSLAAMTGAATLALAGGLAAICFVRLIGVTLLGAPRSEGAARAHEAPLPMTLPVAFLVVVCLASALGAPSLVARLAPLLAELGASGGREVAAAAELLAPVVAIDAALLGAVALVLAIVLWSVGRPERAETWGCGYAEPTPRMQYTGSAFAELFTARLLPRWLRASVRLRAPRGPFPTSAAYASHSVDPLTRHVYEPFLARAGERFARLRFLQQGNLHIYILYIVATAVVALAWVAARDGWVLAP